MVKVSVGVAKNANDWHVVLIYHLPVVVRCSGDLDGGDTDGGGGWLW